MARSRAEPPTGRCPEPVIDLHAHALVPGVASIVERFDPAVVSGAESAVLGEQSRAEMIRGFAAVAQQLQSPSERRDWRQRAGVDVHVLSPSPGQFHYWADLATARSITSAINAGMTEAVAADPAGVRAIGYGPLQHPAELPAALADALASGLLGVELSTHAPTPDGPISLGDPRLEPFWQRAEEAGAIVLIHPHSTDAGPRLARWYLANTVGVPYEHAAGLGQLILSGVLDRHPGLRIVVAHGGGSLPAVVARLDHAWAARSDARAQALEPPSSYLRRIWVDSLVYTPQNLRRLVEDFGPDRVVLGSDFPFDMGVPDPVERLRAAGLDARTEALVLSGTAAQLGIRM